MCQHRTTIYMDLIKDNDEIASEAACVKRFSPRFGKSSTSSRKIDTTDGGR